MHLYPPTRQLTEPFKLLLDLWLARLVPLAINDSPMLHRFCGESDGSSGEKKVGEGCAPYLAGASKQYPLGRLPEVSEIAKATIFLLSDSASMITGHCLPVEGGLLCLLITFSLLVRLVSCNTKIWWYDDFLKLLDAHEGQISFKIFFCFKFIIRAGKLDCCLYHYCLVK